MTAERLREAAAKMRSLAEGAYRGPWTSGEDWVRDGEHDYDEGPMAFIDGGVYRNVRNTAAYIAAMHPGVALALADLLIEIAAQLTHDVERDLPEALAVADAFLAT